MIHGYQRYKCKCCGKRYARNIYSHPLVDSFKTRGFCSMDHMLIWQRKAAIEKEIRKVKEEAEFITKVAKEVIRLERNKEEEEGRGNG